MKRYCKKPIVIEAIQFFSEKNFHECQRFTGYKIGLKEMVKFVVPTLEGEHVISEGDFIIKGVKGEFYPCKPDVFELTYEEVGE
jgi:hypothetical protein